MTLNPAAAKLAGELADAIESGDNQSVMKLVYAARLPRNQRLEVCRMLDQPREHERVVFVYDRFDKAHVA